MNMKTDIKLFESNGKRLDGRMPDELREIKIEVGVLHRAEGSCYLEWGGNKVIAAVYGPREAIPRHTQNPLRAIIISPPQHTNPVLVFYNRVLYFVFFFFLINTTTGSGQTE